MDNHSIKIIEADHPDYEKLKKENKFRTAFQLKNGDIFHLGKLDSDFQYEDQKAYQVSYKGAMLYGLVNGIWERTGEVYTIDELSKKLMESDDQHD